MIHELIDPKKKTKKTKSSRNLKSFIPTKFTFDETSFEGSENSNKDSSSTVFISPWIRNSFGGKQKNKLSQSNVSPTDLKPIKITLGNSNNSDADSFKANVEENFCAKEPTNFTQSRIQELRISQDSEEIRVFDLFCNEDLPTSGETSRKNCARAEEGLVKCENMGLPATSPVNEDISKNVKTTKQKNKPRRRLPVTSRPTEITQNGIEMALLMEMKAGKDSCMKAVSHSPSSEGKLKANEAQPEVQEKNNQIRNEEKATPVTGGSKQISVGNLDGVREGEIVEDEKKLPKKDAKDSNKTRSGDDKCKKETHVEVDKPTKDIRHRNETPKEPPKASEEDWEKKRITEFLTRYKDEEEEEETKCLEEVKKFLERKKRTRQTKHRFYQASTPISEPHKLEELPKEKLKLYRVKGTNIVPCSENVVEKAVDEALQKFVEIYHFHVSHGVMESMKKDIMRALTTESENNSCTKLSKDEKDISNFPELEQRHYEILKNDRLILKEPPSGDLNLCKQVINEYSNTASLRKEFETFLNFIRSHMDVSNLKVRNIILEEKEKNDSSERLQFVCNFAKKEVLRVRQHKHEETQTMESDHKKNVKSQLLDSKDATCDKNFQPTSDGQTQTIHEPLSAKKSVRLQVFESKNVVTCDKSQETETTNINKGIQTELQVTTVSEMQSLKRCNIKPGLYRLIKSREAGRFFLYQERNQSSQGMLGKYSQGSVVKDKKYGAELRSQPSKERSKERSIFFEGKEKIRKKKKNKQKKKKQEEERKDSIDYIYFRNFDRRGSSSSISKKEEDDEKMSVTQPQNIGHDQSRISWLWDGERLSPGCDLKNQVENLVMEKLTEMCNMWYNPNQIALNATNDLKEGEEILHRTISEKTFDVTSYKDLEEESPTLGEEKWASKKEENNEGEDLLYCSRENSVKSLDTLNADWKFVSQYLPKLRDFGVKLEPRKKPSSENSLETSQKLERLREAEELLLAVEKLKEINIKLKNENLMDGDATHDSMSTSRSRTVTVEVPLHPIRNSGIPQVPNSDIQRRLEDKRMALVAGDTDPENFYDLRVTRNKEIEAEIDRRRQMELIGNVFSGIKRQEKENLWRDIKKKIGRNLNNGDDPGEVCIEIEQEIPESKEGMNPSIMGNNDCTPFEGEFEVEVDLTLEDLERILSLRRKKMKRRSSYRSRHLKSSSSNHSERKDSFRRYQKYLQRFTDSNKELVERSSKTF